jgi:alkanesulfonate monooxygenase SsuD/methylene tetrahydromethanopterin reductase-like flavin-dependent oxidoreductase (luciferase family)
MRVGHVVDQPDGAAWPALRDEASAAEACGIEIVYVRSDGAIQGAAALAATTRDITVAAEVRLGATHPILSAEQISVADRLLGGRLIVVLEPDTGHEEVFTEAVEVVLMSLGSRPFSHHGNRWSIPARLADNEYSRDTDVRVMPPPAQIELPVWVGDRHGLNTARELGLAHVSDSDSGVDDLKARWEDTFSVLGRRSLRLRRPAVRRIAGESGVDAEAVVGDLRTQRMEWGMDVALLEAPRSWGVETRIAQLERIAREVLPRVQLGRYPDGLERVWRAERERDPWT